MNILSHNRNNTIKNQELINQLMRNALYKAYNERSIVYNNGSDQVMLDKNFVFPTRLCKEYALLNFRFFIFL